MRELFAALATHAAAPGGRMSFDDGTTRLDGWTLARRVAACAAGLARLPAATDAIGLLGGSRVEWVVGQLAIWHAGRSAVPLPAYLRTPQLAGIVRDAGVAHVLATPDAAERAAELGLPFSVIDDAEAPFAPPRAGEARHVIYTSGSTGTPKGVVLGSRQMMWSAGALATAIDAGAEDSYLSILPPALLLETICAVLVPILSGAPVRLASGLAEAFDAADGASLSAAIAAHRPSCLVLVPELLSRWVAALEQDGTTAPESLRLVAVGGATVPPALAARAWARGIPVHEGYGLSECGSVVALNRPGTRRAGTVGKPLPGLDVRVDDGEIVVRGPSVMERYLHGQPVSGEWRTGDLGAFDADGNLIVHGRLDNLIVTPIGRNVSPEWIEALLAADPRVSACAVAHLYGPHLVAALVPSARGAEWFARASAADIAAFADACCRDVPAYAVPREFVVVPKSALAGCAGTPRRALLEVCAASLPSPAQRVTG